MEGCIILYIFRQSIASDPRHRGSESKSNCSATGNITDVHHTRQYPNFKFITLSYTHVRFPLHSSFDVS